MEPTYLEKRYVTTASGRVYYWVDQSFINRPIVVFLHGLSSNHTTWLSTMDTFHRHKINCLAVELRGHGWSDQKKQRSSYQLPVYIDDLKAIVTAEKIKHLYIVGYSFGGPIAMGYAADQPKLVAGLVLISANYLSPLIHLRLRFLKPVIYGFLQLAALLLLWQQRRQYIYYNHHLAKGYLHSTWVGLNTMPLSVNFWMFAQLFRINLTSVLPKITAPTLVVRANNDPFFSLAEAKQMVKLVPNAQLVSPKHSSHFVASRAQSELGEIILAFIQKHEDSHI